MSTRSWRGSRATPREETRREAGRGHPPASHAPVALMAEGPAPRWQPHHTNRMAPGTSTFDGDVAAARGSYSTSHPSGMLSVRRARPIQTATSAIAGPLNRWSSASEPASATLT